MKIIESLRNKFNGTLAGFMIGSEGLKEAVTALEVSQERLMRSKEGIADLEISLEDMGWREMNTPFGSVNFTRANLRQIMSLSRLMYLKNPLIKRAVTVQELYVFGSGCTIKADSTDVQEVLDDFFSHKKNQKVIGQSWPEREREQRIDGNTFFVFFKNKVNGAARVRLIPVDQIDEVVVNPEDSKEPWYYKRTPITSINGDQVETSDSMLYPDIGYNPRVKPASYTTQSGTYPVKWDTGILHVKTGGLSVMSLGLPELYATLNWATAYKKILENFATIIQAYARIAMKMTGLAGKAGVAAAKSKLNTAVNTGRLLDNNPPPNTGSWAMLSGNVDVSPIKTANSTTGPDEARALRSMVASGSDTPEHFFGDSDIGNFATSTTLDRPTELKMVSRQGMWSFVMQEMIGKLIEWSAVAPDGKLRNAGYIASIKRDPFDGELSVTVTPPKGGSLRVTVTFPSILERDVVDRVRAVVQAATLGGSKAEGIIPDRKYLAKLLLIALGEKDVDAMIQLLYPSDVIQGFIDPADVLKNETLAAKGRKELGDAAILQAEASKAQAENPKPAPKKEKP